MVTFPLLEFTTAEQAAMLQIIDGDRGVNYPTKTEMYLEGHCVFLNTGNIKNDTFDLTFADYITIEKDAKLKKGKLDRKDIVLTTRGTVGSVAHFNNHISKDHIRINSGMVILRVRQNLDDTYLYQVVKSEFLKKQFYLFGSGSAQPQLPIKDLQRIKFPAPPLLIQRKIAAVLSAYDDLIENNNRRIAFLEKMAEELYREWFVRLRFPGHEKVKIVKGVPEGWEVKSFAEAVEINPAESILKDELRPYVGMEDLSQTSMFFVSKENRIGGAGSKFRNRDVLLPRITPSLENGKRGFTTTLEKNQVAIGSTEFIVCREKDIPAEYIYFLTCSEDFRKHAELSMVGASGRQRVSENCFDFFLIKVPPTNIWKQFTSVATPMFESIALLAKRNSNLEQSRDGLLSRLMSGKIDVEKMDIRFPESMKEEGVAHA